ncbi:protein FAM240C-like [Amia ocellicauda]|uniref:protein FAM240C-like n=1 Tax=Amia ocellicauda TaxID=2972642 RepID=UPI003464AE7E
MSVSRREVLIHDKLAIKSFWEQKIDSHSQMSGSEEERMKSSALCKLRDEWVQRLESRTKHLKKFNDDLLQKRLARLKDVA